MSWTGNSFELVDHIQATDLFKGHKYTTASLPHQALTVEQIKARVLYNEGG